MKDVVIVSAVRTPIGSFGGVFKDVSAVSLATSAVKDVLNRINLSPNKVDELILGNVLQAGSGQNVARQVAINAGIPDTTPSYTVNKLCASGLKAVTLAIQSIKCGDCDIIVAGGSENMSQSPYLVNTNRFGSKLGNSVMVDSIIKDGLTDAFSGEHMGITAENIAEKFNISRETQDKLALSSQNKAQKAIEQNRFKDEIVPIDIIKRGKIINTVYNDEYPKFDMTLEKLAKLRPAFKKDGTVTAGNSSGINDGSAVLVLMSKEKAQELDIKILATVKSYASSGVCPDIMGTGPIPATQKAIKMAGISLKDIDLIESNEAFAVQAISVKDELGFDDDKLNVNGGAIALGHPIGASGARILVTLLYEMQKREVSTGLATLCVGGGQGVAIIIAR